MHFSRNNVISFVFLLAIAFLALLLRLRGFPQDMPFFGDVGRTYLAADEILSGNILLTGPKTSVGNFHLGPFYYYLTAWALFLSKGNPVGPGVMVAIFGSLAVFALGAYLLLFVHRRAAVIGASILAFSPLVIEQSRIPIEPSPVPFFTILWLFCATFFWQSKKVFWILASLVIVFFGAQLNFSFIVFGAVSIITFVWKSVRQPYQKRFLIFSGGLAVLAVVGKILFRPTTSLDYFTSMWLRYSFPGSELASMLIFSLFVFCLIVLFVQKQKWSDLFPVWYAWGFFALCAFFLKTVGGNHALAILFPFPALIMGAVFGSLPAKYSQILVGVLLLAWFGSALTTFPQESTLFEAKKVTDAVLETAHGKPYQLSYRGHLDVYEAVDDHWQFLLAKKGNPPSQEGINLVLYSPAHPEELFDFPQKDVIQTQQVGKNILLQVVP